MSDVRSAAGLSLAAVLMTGAAVAGGGHCHNDGDCAPWQDCSVGRGECGGGDSPLDVCTGDCVAGESWRVVARAGAAYTYGLPPNPASVAIEAEVVPPVWEGVPSLTLGLMPLQGAARASANFSGGFSGLRAGISLGGLVAYGFDRSRVGGALFLDKGLLLTGRAELFPWALWSSVTPFHHLSLSVEAGAAYVLLSDFAGLAPFISLGAGWWF